MKKFIKSLLNTIRAKSGMVVVAAVIVFLMYVIYSKVVSPIRFSSMKSQISLAEENNTTEGLFDMRKPVKEAFGTGYEDCIAKGYDEHFCLRSENLHARREDIPL